MSRLPTVGGDDNTWGNVLNDFLKQEHNPDGTLKDVVRPADPRLSDSRTPTAHKDSHKTGGSDALAPSDIGAASTTDLSSKADDSSVVHLAGTETITGDKDFTGGATINSTNIVVTGDTRLTDARTPTDGSVTDAKITSGGLSPSKVAGTALVSSALDTDSTLAANSDTKIPSQKAVKTYADTKLPSNPDAQIRYVDPVNGSDSHLGLSQGNAFATIQAAYDSLPDMTGAPSWVYAGGGVLVLMDGRHDVGNGLIAADGKPAVVTSLSGHLTYRGAGLTAPYIQQNAVIFSSSHATALFKLLSPSTHQTHGWEFHGIGFDLSDPLTTTGIYCENICYMVIDDCSVGGSGTVEQYFVRGLAKDTGGGDADASWYRIQRNNVRNAGIAHLGDVGTNSNQHVISDNTCFPGNYSWGIKLEGNDRSITHDNNIEGNGPGAILLTDSWRCRCVGDAGEGTLSPFIKNTGGGENYFDPIGAHQMTSSMVLIEDNNGENHYGSLAAMRNLGPAWLHVKDSGDVAPSGFAGRGLIYPTFASLPVRLDREQLPIGRRNFNLINDSLLSAEYWNGSAWVTWSPTNLTTIAHQNTDGFTVDATHQRFRIFTGTILDVDGDAPIVECRFLPWEAYSSAETFTVSVDRLDTSDGMQEAGVPCTIRTYQTGFRGCVVPLPWKSTAPRLRIEFNFTAYFATGSGQFTFKYLAVESQTPTAISNVSGQEFKGHGSPEGIVTAAVGSRYWQLDGTAATYLWEKVTGTGNTGWAAVGTASSDLAIARMPSVDHTANGVKTTIVAAQAQAIGDACYIASTGKAYLAKADAIANATAIAMVCDATIAQDATGNYLLFGTIRDDTWNWTVGGKIYLSITGTTGNTLTQTPPSGANNVIQILGVATAADEMIFSPQLVQVEHV